MCWEWWGSSRFTGNGGKSFGCYYHCLLVCSLVSALDKVAETWGYLGVLLRVIDSRTVAVLFWLSWRQGGWEAPYCRWTSACRGDGICVLVYTLLDIVKLSLYSAYSIKYEVCELLYETLSWLKYRIPLFVSLSLVILVLSVLAVLLLWSLSSVQFNVSARKQQSWYRKHTYKGFTTWGHW